MKNIISALLTLFAVGLAAGSANALQAPVGLGTAGNFVILSKSGIASTGTTSIVGNIGSSPIASIGITGFGLTMDASNQFSRSSLVNGSVYASDYAPPTPSNMTNAVLDMETAYADAAGRSLPDFTELGAGNIGGMTLGPGLYKWGTGVQIPPGGVTLSGSATDVWIFQIAQDLTVSNGAIVTLAGSAQSKNIFWQVAGKATLGTTADFKGVILSRTLISLNTGATLNGRALAQTAVTLIANAVTAPPSSAARDFNGDGKSDLVLQLADGSTYVALLNGTSFVSGGFQTGPGSTIKVVGVGDLNGDGKADLAWQLTDGSIYLGLMNGINFVSGAFLTGPGTSKVVGVGDFSGDGKADIALQLADGSIYIALMNGTSFVSGGFMTGPGTFKVVGVGDFNGDAKSDLVLQLTDGSTFIALMNGSSYLSGAYQTGPGSTIKVVGVGDFNGDGKADLVWQLTDGSTYIGLMNGTSWTGGAFQGTGSTIKVVGVGDFNSDGKADLAWQLDDGSIYLGLMNGTSWISGAFLTGPGSLVVKP